MRHTAATREAARRRAQALLWGCKQQAMKIAHSAPCFLVMTVKLVWERKDGEAPHAWKAKIGGLTVERKAFCLYRARFIDSWSVGVFT